MLRRLKPFEYMEPENIDEALECLDKFGDRAKMFAGGTDLMVQMKQKELDVRYIVNITSINGLDYIIQNEDGDLCIGALTTIRELETSPLIINKYPVIREACSVLGSVQVRNRATVGGNLCNAAPSAEMAPAMLVSDCRVKLYGSHGERIIPLHEFFVGPGITALKKELMKEIIIPLPPHLSKATYLKHSPRRAMDLAIVGVAVLLSFSDESKSMIREARIALGAVAPTPFRAVRAETLLSDKPVEAGLYREAALLAAEDARPISDIRASAEYREEMIKVLAYRALEKVSV